jgi:hypothetical protein
MTKGGDFIPGHDAKLLSAIVGHVGGIARLREIVEMETRSPVDVETNDVPSVCPECGHQFQGIGWGGIDAHWRSKHEGLMTYEKAWPLIRSGEYGN